MPDSDDEIAYYRAVEDVFATVRGVPHTLSPRDFQLLREWWRDRIPLAAVTSGITEVLAKRRSRDEDDPVVSLSYCRHAVRRHAKRLAQMHVGESLSRNEGDQTETRSLRTLTEQLLEVGERWQRLMPEVALAIKQVAEQMTGIAELPPALLEEHLFAIEAVMFDRCWHALPEERRDTIERSCREAAEASGGTASTRGRTHRAVRDRELRELLGLPRLEFG